MATWQGNKHGEIWSYERWPPWVHGLNDGHAWIKDQDWKNSTSQPTPSKSFCHFLLHVANEKIEEQPSNFTRTNTRRINLTETSSPTFFLSLFGTTQQLKSLQSVLCDFFLGKKKQNATLAVVEQNISGKT